MNPREFLKQQEAEQNEAIKDLVKISNSLVESFVSKNNAVALKMLFYIAKQRQKESGEITTFTLSIDEFATYCKLDHRTIRDNIKAMQKTSVTFVEYKKDGKPKLERHIVLGHRTVMRVKIGALSVWHAFTRFNFLFNSKESKLGNLNLCGVFCYPFLCLPLS